MSRAFVAHVIPLEVIFGSFSITHCKVHIITPYAAQPLLPLRAVIGRALPSASFAEWAQAIGVYVMTVNKSIDHEQYKQALASILPTQFESGSLADRLLIQGRE